MPQPYFDETECVDFYRRFTKQGDKGALDALLEQCMPMCQYNAIRIAPGEPELISDLVGIGILRILEIIHKRKYTPRQGSIILVLHDSEPQQNAGFCEAG